MPSPPAISVVIGESGLPTRRLDTRNAKTQTDGDGPSVAEELKSLADWLAASQQNKATDGYMADGLEESNRDLTVPTDATWRATTGASNPAAGDEPASSKQLGTATGFRTGVYTSLDRLQPTAAIFESKGAADLA